MRRKGTVGILVMTCGAVLLLAALSLFLWNQREERQAEAYAQSILLRLKEETETAKDPLPLDMDASEMAETEIEGYSYIGYLSIPVLNLELPVMSDWSYPKLKLAPCRYFGSVWTEDLVIAAHNYSSHFGNLKNLRAGDLVYFTDINGTVFTYEVEELVILAPTAVEEVTAGDYDLTLYTCTYGGQSRVTVRLNQVKNNTETKLF